MWERIFSEVGQKLSRNAVADMYAHISWEDLDFTKAYIHQLISFVEDATFDKLVKFERPLTKVTCLQDVHENVRVSLILVTI